MIPLRITNGKTWTETANLKVWDKNPRTIEQDDFERLKRQLSELGQYKPLLVTEDGEVVGGNMRFRAYSELGVKEVWVSILGFADVEGRKGEVSVLIDGKFQKFGDSEIRTFKGREQAMLEYSMSDNDSAGKTDKQALAELAHPYIEVIPMGNYKIEVYEGQPLLDVVQSISSPKEEVRPDSTGEIEAEDTIVISIKLTKEEYAEIEPDMSQFKDVNEADGNGDMLKKLLDYWRKTKDMPMVETPIAPVDNNGDNSAPAGDNVEVPVERVSTETPPTDVVNQEVTSALPSDNVENTTPVDVVENPPSNVVGVALNDAKKDEVVEVLLTTPSDVVNNTPEVVEPVVNDDLPPVTDASVPPTTEPVVTPVVQEVVVDQPTTTDPVVTVEQPTVAEESLTADELFTKAREATLAGNVAEGDRLANLARAKESNVTA